MPDCSKPPGHASPFHVCAKAGPAMPPGLNTSSNAQPEPVVSQDSPSVLPIPGRLCRSRHGNSVTVRPSVPIVPACPEGLHCSNPPRPSAPPGARRLGCVQVQSPPRLPIPSIHARFHPYRAAAPSGSNQLNGHPNSLGAVQGYWRPHFPPHASQRAPPLSPIRLPCLWAPVSNHLQDPATLSHHEPVYHLHAPAPLYPLPSASQPAPFQALNDNRLTYENLIRLFYANLISPRAGGAADPRIPPWAMRILHWRNSLPEVFEVEEIVENDEDLNVDADDDRHGEGRGSADLL
ncbi:hypothetical protein BKA70DRAFT_450401 [Coprinopsis sp. MPI-PUGE-AT-0042]|nr:hypothetical protein BKA70DRAFT_450401 [Coprinopsis sp. MPI-PUGE-AT-0042]